MKIEFSIRLREESCCLHTYTYIYICCVCVCVCVSVCVRGGCVNRRTTVYFCVAAAANSVAFRSKLLQLCASKLLTAD